MVLDFSIPFLHFVSGFTWMLSSIGFHLISIYISPLSDALILFTILSACIATNCATPAL